MGGFYHSICIPSAPANQVKDLLVQWLSAKGFTQTEGEPLLELDEGTQRGVFLISNAQWTILHYSHEEEAERLVFELHKLKRPILEIWMHDSDIWGYRLHQDRCLIASFNSNPAYFGEVEETGLPTNGDPRLLCRTFGLADMEKEIAKVQKASGIVLDGVCERFASLIGAPPAANSYRYLEQDVLTTGALDFSGYQKEHLLFFNDHIRKEDSFDLHSRKIKEPAEPPQPVSSPIPPAMEDHIQTMQHQGRILGMLLQSLVWLVKIIFIPMGWIMRLYMWTHKEKWQAHTVQRLQFRVDGNTLINARHRCKVTLPEGVVPGTDGNSGFFLSAVLGFRANDCTVICRAIGPKDLDAIFQVRLLSHAHTITVLEEENYKAGSCRAKFVLLKVQTSTNPNQGTTYQGLHIVQTPQAIYQFQYITHAETSAETKDKIRQTVESFELLSDGTSR